MSEVGDFFSSTQQGKYLDADCPQPFFRRVFAAARRCPDDIDVALTCPGAFMIEQMGAHVVGLQLFNVPNGDLAQ